MALIIFVLGFMQVLTATTIWIFLIAGSFVAAVPIVKLWPALVGDFHQCRKTLRQNAVEYGLLLVIPVFITLLNLVWAVAPEVQFDALNYHLAVPKLYLEHSGIYEIQFYQAYLVRLVEMIFAACLALCGPEAAKLWVFLMCSCGPIALFALAKDVFDTRVGIWAAALFMTTL